MVSSVIYGFSAFAVNSTLPFLMGVLWAAMARAAVFRRLGGPGDPGVEVMNGPKGRLERKPVAAYVSRHSAKMRRVHASHRSASSRRLMAGIACFLDRKTFSRPIMSR